MPPIPLLLSAGEASGDMYAAGLAKALQERMDVQIFGMGGPQMRAAGVEIITDYSEVAVVGITEVLGHLPSLLRAMDRLVKRSGPPQARAGNPYGLPRVSPAAGAQTGAARHSQRLLHLPAILGLAAVAGAADPRAICKGTVHFSV